MMMFRSFGECERLHHGHHRVRISLTNCVALIGLKIREVLAKARGRPPNLDVPNRTRLPQSNFLSERRTAETAARVHGFADVSFASRFVHGDLDSSADGRAVGLHANQLELQPA